MNLRHSRESGNPAKQTNARGLPADRGAVRGFTRDYAIKLLIWFEQHATMESAITREKRIKKWNRAWKLELIEKDNPDWRDLTEDFGLEPLP